MLVTDLLLKNELHSSDVDPALLEEARFWVNTRSVDLGRVQEILGRLWDSPKIDASVLQILAILAVIADDRQSWEKAQADLGAHGDPALGFLAYLRLKMATKDPERLSSWFFIVEHSAALGSFDAKLGIARTRAPKSKSLRKLFFFWKLFTLGIKAVVISARNPADPRLLLERRNKKARAIFTCI